MDLKRERTGIYGIKIILLTIRPVADCCECCNELTVSVKSEEFFE
jgi:hypothetical protein